MFERYKPNSKLKVLGKKSLSLGTWTLNTNSNTVELQWLEHPRDYKNKFETGVVRANEC